MKKVAGIFSIIIVCIIVATVMIFPVASASVSGGRINDLNLGISYYQESEDVDIPFSANLYLYPDKFILFFATLLGVLVLSIIDMCKENLVLKICLVVLPIVNYKFFIPCIYSTSAAYKIFSSIPTVVKSRWYEYNKLLLSALAVLAIIDLIVFIMRHKKQLKKVEETEQI